MIHVSVIVPGFQAAPYARDCLEALLTQALGNLEILCVDDGSSDGTGPLLDEMAARDDRIQVWHTENRGVSAARNLALSHARGEYVAFVDMDDRLPDGALTALYEAACGADIVAGDYERVDAQGQAHRVALPARITRETALSSIVSGEGSYNAPWGKLYRHDFLWEHALAFSEIVSIGEDALLNLEAFDLAERVAHTDAVVYTYYEREDSAMGRVAENRYDRHVPMLDAMDAYLRKTGQKTKYYRDFLQLHAALVASQYGDAPQAFARLATARVQREVAFGRLTAKEQALYLGIKAGMGGTVYQRLMRG